MCAHHRDRMFRPLGRCGGYKPSKPPAGGAYGYANWDIYYLEVCIFNHLCTNGKEMFSINPGGLFTCNFSRERFASLQSMLLSSIGPEPKDAVRCTPTNVKVHKAK